MKSSSIRRRNLRWVRFFTAGLFLVLIFFCVRKYQEGHYTDPLRLLSLNEICTVSPGTSLENGEIIYEDYIELYNGSKETISLEGLYLSDDPAEPLKGALPEITMAPGSFLCIYAVPEDEEAPSESPSVPFGLKEQETLVLSRAVKTEGGELSVTSVDSVYIPEALTSGAVYARTEDGESVFSELRPSAGASNSEASLVLPAPVCLTKSGFYEGSVLAELQASEGLSVRYTLDGSIPDESSPLYTEPLLLTDPSSSEDRYASLTDITAEGSGYLPPDTPVDKAVVLRAASFDGEGNYSNAVTSTYFIDFDSKEGYQDSPILSLVTDPDNLFSDEEGIYVRGSLYDEAIEEGLIYNGLPWSYLTDYTNYHLDGPASERQAHLEFFQGSLPLLSQECGIRIRGNESRSFAQKNFSLYARKRYDGETFEPVFFDTGISYPDLILNGSRTLKKAFFSSLVEDRSAAVQQYLPCQVFLNGEYWGMYYLMERYSPEYLEGHYGAPASNTALIKDTRDLQAGSEEDLADFKALRTYLSEQDLSDPEAYEELLTQMDMDSFIDWMCINIYIANTDTKPLGNNVYTWKSDSATSGKWRFMLYDLDDSLAVGTDLASTPAYAFDSFTGHAGYSPSGFLDDEPMPALMENEDFRRQFVLTFLDLANEAFRSDRVLPLLDELEAQYGAWADLSWERWNTAPQNATFEEQVEELRVFFENRFDFIVPLLAEHFELTGTLAKLSLSAEQGGEITLNSITPDLNGGSWSGYYYTDYAVTLTAKSEKGYAFAGWEIDGGVIEEGNAASESIRLRLDGNAAVRALFVKE